MSGVTITSPAAVPGAVEELDSAVEEGERSKVDEIPK
jgi:hypothetical protein